MGAGHVGLGPGLVDEDQTGRIDRLVPLPPARRRATSGRSCSVANTVFFEADALAHAGTARPCRSTTTTPRSRKLRHQRVQGQIRLLGQPRQQPVALVLHRLAAAAHRLGRSAAGRPRPLRPLHHARDADITAPPPRGRSRQPTTQPHALADQGNRLGPSCWPPVPASSLNQNSTDLGIPQFKQIRKDSRADSGSDAIITGCGKEVHAVLGGEGGQGADDSSDQGLD